MLDMFHQKSTCKQIEHDKTCYLYDMKNRGESIYTCVDIYIYIEKV